LGSWGASCWNHLGASARAICGSFVTGNQLALLENSEEMRSVNPINLGVTILPKSGMMLLKWRAFFETLERQQENSGGGEVPDFLSTHPSPEERNAYSRKNWALAWQAKSKNGTEFESKS